MTIVEMGRRLRAREVTCAGLVDAAVARAAERNSVLNAFITIAGDQAAERARMLDAELAAGNDRGPLHGIPVALKDNLLTRGMRTTGGSKIFADLVPEENAAAVDALEAAGAVVIGKTNMHELAYGIDMHESSLRRGAEPARSVAHPGRIERRLGRGRGGRDRSAGARQRYWRVDTDPCGVLRLHWVESVIRAGR